MDSLSGRVEFRFELSGGKHPDRNLIASRNRKVLAEIEGLLVLTVDDQLFFKEGSLLLLELAVDLMKWLQDLSNGIVRDFQYVSMDYAEGALLRFAHDHGTEWWSLYSPWSEATKNVRVTGQELVSSVQGYLTGLETELCDNFGIRLKDYMDAH